MSYHNFNKTNSPGKIVDRVRGVKMPDTSPTLDVLEEAFTSENWLIRIYKVKDLDNVGRDHFEAGAFSRGQKKKKAVQKRGARVLRVD
jgi:dolichyl-diphosphooligosaccharide--protein glycosyltransferase